MENQTTIPGTEQNNYSTKRYYLSIFQGRLAQKAKEGDNKAEKRINSEDKIVYEIFYTSITGKLRDVILNNGNYGEEILVRIAPNEQTEVQIQISLSSDYAQDFLKRLPNINVAQHVKFSPYLFDDKERKKKDGSPKKNAGISLSQVGIKIKRHFTSETPNGFPMSKKKEDGTLEFLDNDDFKILLVQQKKFLKSVLENWRIKNAPDYQKEREEKQETNSTIPAEVDDWSDQVPPYNKDDLPF